MDKNKKIKEDLELTLNDNKAAYTEDLKIKFFQDSSKKAKIKNLNRTVEEIMNKRNFRLFERRNK